MIARTSTPAMTARASSVRVARRLPLTTPPLADAFAVEEAARLEHVEEEWPAVGRSREIEVRIAGRRDRDRRRTSRSRSSHSRSIGRRLHGATRTVKPWSPRLRRMVAPILIRERRRRHHQRRDALARHQDRRAPRGLAMPKSSSDATPSDSNRVVSDAASGIEPARHAEHAGRCQRA